MSRLTTTLRRMCTAFMLCLSFPAALTHAQYVSFRIEAPKNFDYGAENFGDLREEIGTLKITFSRINWFQDVDRYARYYLDLNDNFQYDSQPSHALKYQSYDLNLFPDGENGVCWGNQNRTIFNVRNLQKSLDIHESSSPIYYRIYSPHFNRMIVGKITPSTEESITIRHDEWAKSRRVVFQPVIGREGTPVSARLAPELRIGGVGGEAYSSRNMYDLRAEQPFVVYAPVGDTLRYLVAPQEENLALHADSLVVTDTTTCVTTDFRKATLCYFYITDTKGNLCPTTGAFGSVYYPHQRITINNSNTGGTYGYGFYNVNNRFTLTAPDGTKAAYVLPGTQTFQFGRPSVETTDPNFLMPYNAQGWYVIKEVTIPASTEPVSISLGKSTPVRTVMTLADAAPYADHLEIGGFTYVSRPYAWSDYTKINIESREVSRQIQGNDLIISTLVEGSTEAPALELTTNFSAQSDTLAPGINAHLYVYSYYYDPGVRVDGEYHFTQEHFYLEELAGVDTQKHPNFSTLHPVKFVIPCHLLQEGYQVKAEYPNNFIATHHEGCAKSLAVGSESPVPYDTLTVILPEGQYSWYMRKGNEEPKEDQKNLFTLDATGPAEQHLADNQFSLLRVTNLGVDSVYIFNNVPEPKRFWFYKAIKGNEGYKQYYYANESIPLHAGYNEHAIEYRQIKIEKDTFNAIDYEVDGLYFFKEYEEDIYHPSYLNYTVGSDHSSIDRMATSTPDKAINISTGTRANVATSFNYSYSNYPAYLIEVAPSSADTVVSIYDKKLVRTNFTFNGNMNIPEFEWLNMCYNNQQTHVAIPRGIIKRGKLYLLPGHYTMEGVVWGEEYEDGLIPIKVAFDVPSADVIELNSSIIEAIAPVMTEEGSTPQVQARYTIDGRRIAVPQPGVNIIKMSNGTIRKVMVK